MYSRTPPQDISKKPAGWMGQRTTVNVRVVGGGFDSTAVEVHACLYIPDTCRRFTEVSCSASTAVITVAVAAAEVKSCSLCVSYQQTQVCGAGRF